jgi:L-iditol 2-dehydrogenase
MRVAMYYNNNDIRIEEMPRPAVGPGELLLRVEASGICGSDVMEWYRARKAPLVLGHEIAGQIVEVGQGVRHHERGNPVVASHHVPCNVCRHCLKGHHTVCDTLRGTNFDPGGFAEYVRLPAINVDRGVYPIPPGISWEEASLTEPLACVLRGQRTVQVGVGDTVAVVGSGMAGLLHVQLARARGATKIFAIDVEEKRLAKAKLVGADMAIHADEDPAKTIKRETGGWLADKVLVCTGAKSALLQALTLVERGGHVLFFAPTEPGVTVSLSINDVFFGNDVTLATSYAGSPADHFTAMDLIGSGQVRVGELISHRLPLEATQRGFELVSTAKDCLKVIIQPQR